MKKITKTNCKKIYKKLINKFPIFIKIYRIYLFNKLNLKFNLKEKNNEKINTQFYDKIKQLKEELNLNNQKKIDNIFFKNKIYKTDKNTIHSYIKVYNLLFDNLKNINLLEIGVQYGGSLKMWRDKFPGSNIYGIDINPIKIKRVNIIIGDATKKKTMKKLNNINFDVIIDDGSHKLEDQLRSFELFYPKLKKGGFYIIEDIQDIDNQKKYFQGAQILDMRKLKERYDNVLAIYQK
jgi:cephalosporin hydroxylase